MPQSSPGTADAKARAAAAVEARADQLLDISHRIHENPELGFAEYFAHDLLADAAEGAGLAVQRQAYGVETAFAARAGSSGPLVAILCEYDALPGIGHACGHNIIAASGLGAGLAAAEVVEELGGRLLILGTPAEEGGGGKVRLIDGGALEGVDAAIMLHPAGLELAEMQTLAVQQLHARYHGRAAHAAAAPHVGRNALDGAVLGYVAAAALRQHIGTDERLHGIFTDGGQKPNIVPAYAETNWYVRSPTTARLEGTEGAPGRLPDRRSRGRGSRPRVALGGLQLPRSAKQCAACRALVRQCGSSRPAPAATCSGTHGDRQHRHGQRQPTDSLDPSHDCGRATGRGHPHRILRRLRPERQRRPRRDRRRQDTCRGGDRLLG